MRRILSPCVGAICLIFVPQPVLSQTIISMPAPPKVQDADDASNAATDEGAPSAAVPDALGVTAVTRYTRARIGSDYTYGMMNDDPLRGRYVTSYGWPAAYSPAVFYGSPWGWGGGWGWGGYRPGRGGHHHGHHHHRHGGWWWGTKWNIDIRID